MQKRILKSAVSVLMLSAASTAIMPMTVSFAEKITYDGTPATQNLLHEEFIQDNDPNTTWYSLYPGTLNAPGNAGNVVNVTNPSNLEIDYDPEHPLPASAYYNAPHAVYGGYTETAGVSITDNKVVVSGGLISNDVRAGRGTTVVTGNSVDLSGGWVLGSIYGGWSDNTVNSSNNTVNITGGQINGAVSGAFAASDTNANVSGNKVTVSGSASDVSFIIGAEAMGDGELNVSGNSVEISNGATTGRVFGGANSSDGVVTGNSVAISTKAAAETIYGGSTFGSGIVSGNSVSVNNASVSEEIYGGHSDNIGEVSDNHVNVVEGSTVNRVIGGFSENSGTVASNSVTFNNSTADGQILAGWSVNGQVNNNTVSITNGTLKSDAVGGYTNNGASANENKVTITGTTQVDGNVAGGYVGNGVGSARNNMVQTENGTFAKTIFGAQVASGDAVANQVIMNGGEAEKNIIGGYSRAGTVDSNIVSISSTRINGQVLGGQAVAGLAKGNQVNLSNATVKSSVAGGLTENSSLVENNKVTISNKSIITGPIMGGYSELGSASGNSVIISDSIANDHVYGGRAGVTDNVVNYANNNYVEINSSQLANRVTGGNAIGNGEATNNKVLIRESNLTKDIVGGWSDLGLVKLNDLTISNSTIGTDAVAGYVDGGQGNAEQNSLTLSNGAIVKNMAVGGYATNGNANENKVSVTDSTISQNVYGGWSVSGDAINNTVTLNGTNVNITGFVYGGFSVNQSGDQFTGNTLNLNGYRGSVASIYNVQNYNWVLPKDVVNNDVLVHVTGAAVDLNNTNHTVAIENDGNRLNTNDQIVMIDKASGAPLTTPTQVQQGQFITYDVNMRVDANNKFVLNVADRTDTTPDTGGGESGGGNTGGETGGGNTGGETGGGNTGGETGGGNTGGETGGGNTGGETGGGNTGGETGGGNTGGETGGGNTGGENGGGNTGGENGGGNTGGETSGGNTGSNAGSGNTSGSNAGTVIEEATRPSVTPAGRINPRTKAYSEGRAGALAFVNQAGDVIATSGIQSALAAIDAQNGSGQNFTVAPFMILSGSSQRYNTGSHVDIDGFNMAIGLAGATQVEAGHKIMFGAFYEYGHGTYKTYNGFENLASVRGDGETDYNGGGVFGRVEFAGTGLGRVTNLSNTQTDGLYLDASVRGGKTKLEFDSNDLYDGEGYRGHYNSKASYIGAHATLGYVFNFDEKQALDVYSRYLWTRVNGDNVVIGRDTLHFDRSTSSRIQLGGRYNYTYSQQFIPYVGLAYEHEFKGTVSANAYGLALGEPSLQGDSGIVEAGFMVRPIATAPDLSVNIGGQGFFGLREGGAGSLKVKYQF